MLPRCISSVFPKKTQSVRVLAQTNSLHSVNIRSRPAHPRLNSTPTVIAKTRPGCSCKPATGTTSEGPPALPPYTIHLYPPTNTSKSLTMSLLGKKFPVKVGESPKHARASKEEGGGAQAELEGTCNGRNRALTSLRNNSSAHVAVLHCRYDTLRPGCSDWMRKRDRAEVILGERGAKAESLQAWSSHTASTPSPPLLLPVRFYPPFCFAGDLERGGIIGGLSI